MIEFLNHLNHQPVLQTVLPVLLAVLFGEMAQLAQAEWNFINFPFGRGGRVLRLSSSVGGWG